MKKYISIMFLSLWLGVGQVVAQYCPDKNISTNPDNPVSETGSIAEPNPFDWREEEFDIYSQYQANSVIESPFFHANNLDLDHLTENLDMKPEDGWELLTYKTGKNPDGTNMSTQADFVYFILYNKFTGIMRVMAAGDPSGNHNGARLMLEFGSSEYYPSVYSHTSDIHEVEDFTAADKTAFSVMRYKEGSSKWFYSDFPIAYDPCTCLYESKMSIGISLVDKATISITGNITGTLSNIDNQTSGAVNENGYAFKDVRAAATKANKTYKSISKFTEKQEKAIKIEGKTNLQLTLNELCKRMELNEFQTSVKKSNFLTEGLKAAPYIGGALELLDFFISGGKKSSGPQEVKLTPTAINANIKLQGELDAPYYFDDIIFYTPGSENANNGTIPAQYPYYNEIMGTVNLMQKPEIHLKLVETEYDPPIPGAGSETFSHWFKLDQESVKLLLNPSSDLQIEEISGALILGVEDNGYYPVFWNNVIPGTNGLNVVSPTIRSRIVPLGCLPDMPIWVKHHSTIQEEDVFLKLYVNLKREDADPNTQNILFVAKYPVNLVDKTYDTSIDWTTPYNFPGKVELDNTVSSDVNAWDTIIVKNGTTFQPGPNGITVVAGREIIVEPGVDIPAGVELIVGDPTQCSQSIAFQNSSQIQSFCNSSSYKTTLRDARIIQQPDSHFISLSLTAHPNPFNETFTLRYELPSDGQVSIILLDMMGRPIMQVQQTQAMKAGAQEITVDANGLAAGLYHVVLQAGDQRETVKIVKQ